jgi:hypothetical protein
LATRPTALVIPQYCPTIWWDASPDAATAEERADEHRRPRLTIEAAPATNTKPTAGSPRLVSAPHRREQRQASGIGGDVQSGDGSRRRGGTDVGLDVGGVRSTRFQR